MPRSLSAAVLLASAASVGDELSLPDPLTTAAGEMVRTVSQWRSVRRDEILEQFRTSVYGRTPVGRPDDLRFEVVETDPVALGGKATLKRVDIRYSGPGGEGAIELVLFVPNSIQAPAAGFLLICNRERENIDPARKTGRSFWPAERMVERGYFAAAFHKSDLDPDHHDGFRNGVHGLFDSPDQPRPPDAWGTIAAWAWGAGRAMDYFETDDDIDAKHVAVVGHSRGGKTALWCGAEDTRFAMAVSNNSGCTGAALARRRKGETIAEINKRFPHWFCANYRRFDDQEEALPVDQHQLIALMAPRPVYVASASQDAWADPEGEFLACVHAAPVYALFGHQGVGTDRFPDVNRPCHTGHVGYHIRAGKHDLTVYDWDRFMDFADRHWRSGKGAPAPPHDAGR